MNKLFSVFVLCFTAALFFGSSLFAQFTKEDIGTAGASFLKLSKNVRAAGMGDAYAGISNDVNGIFWNPAGLNQVNSLELSVMYTSWIEGLFFNSFSIALPVNNAVTAVSFNYLGMSPIEKYYNNNESAGEFYSPYDILGYFTYAFKVNQHLFGINFQIFNSVIDRDSATSYGFDFGYMKKLFNDKLSCGAVIQNAGSSIKFNLVNDPLPLNLKLGAAYYGWIKNLTVAMDLNFPAYSNPGVNLGAEYLYETNEIALLSRIGFKTNTVNYLGAFSGLSAGFGVVYKNLLFDYAWMPFGESGNINKISLSYRFESINFDYFLKKLWQENSNNSDDETKPNIDPSCLPIP